MMDRIIFLGTQVDDYTANTLQAQLLYLDSVDPVSYTHLDVYKRQRANSPVIMVANKTDNNELQYNAPEFYKLGLSDPYCISAITGSGTGDLMDLIVSKFNKETDVYKRQHVSNLPITRG